MKSIFINDLRAGEELIDEPLLLKDMVRRTTKDGRPYILCTLGDRTGQMSGVFWDLPPSIDQWIQSGLVLYVTGKVSKYKDSLQIGITDAYPQEHPDLSEFLLSSARPQQEMLNELHTIIEGLSFPYGPLVKKLLLREPFMTQFANAPAAKTMHHACVGGLLEHSLSMASLASMVATHYPHIDKDLLVAGALLHDLGKVYEYAFEGAFEVSDDGRLVGHISRAAIIVEKAADTIEGMTELQLQQLLHLILSHHGTLEWGSPIKPKTIEAILLHQIDLLDSRVQGFFDHLNSDGSNNSWSIKPSPMHSTYLRRPDSME